MMDLPVSDKDAAIEKEFDNKEGMNFYTLIKYWLMWGVGRSLGKSMNSYECV